MQLTLVKKTARFSTHILVCRKSCKNMPGTESNTTPPDRVRSDKEPLLADELATAGVDRFNKEKLTPIFEGWQTAEAEKLDEMAKTAKQMFQNLTFDDFETHFDAFV